MGLFSKKENIELFQLLQSDEQDGPLSDSFPKSEMPRHALTAEEVVEPIRFNDTTPNKPVADPMAALRRRMAEAAAKKDAPKTETQSTDVYFEKVEEPVADEPVQEKLSGESLLERCRAYTTDSSGHSVLESEEPSYTLESVHEILMDGKTRTVEMLKEKYGLELESIPMEPKPEPVKAEEPPKDEPVQIADSEEKPRLEISDLDPIPLTAAIPDPTDLSSTATIRFTPVRADGENGEQLRVTTQTRQIDLTGEISSFSDEAKAEEMTSLNESDFDSFEDEENPDDPTELKKLARRYAIQKRTAFFQSFLSVLLTLAIAAFYLPIFSGLLIHSTQTGMFVVTGILGATLLINLDLFAAIPRLFSKRPTFDANVLLAELGILLCGILSAVMGENMLTLILLGGVLFCARSITLFMSLSALTGNLRQLLNPKDKKAVALIDDPSVTFAMAKTSIEGDVLAAVPQKADSVANFMKYSRFFAPLNGKLRAVTIVSLIVAVALGVSYGIVAHNAVIGSYIAAAVLSLGALPLLLLSETLPNFSAAARLNKKGSYIAGITGAEHLDQANAIVLSTKDIFPSGSVTLHDLKVLNPSDFDRIILRAASLTEAMGSPLSPIFKRIAGTDESYEIPSSDSFKYEKDLGISGWVDDQIMFIGNRTIMEAHGIAVPSIETDHKILRSGFFPVYLAYGGKACALLSVQYAVDPVVVRELHRSTRAGITLLFRNCDPNLTEEMLFDYFGLYEDSVKIMSNAGVNMCRMAVAKTETCSSPAVFRGNPINFMSLMNCASRVKQSNRTLSVLYILTLCLGTMLFLYLSFSGIGSMPDAATLLQYHLLTTVLGYIIYWIKRP